VVVRDPRERAWDVVAAREMVVMTSGPRPEKDADLVCQSCAR